jgi:CsoR family transcriptional regulator, copper-sensing transcriptional repressor
MSAEPKPTTSPSVECLPEARRVDLVNRLRRAEGQMRGLLRLLENGADCARIAQQLLATRHALDSTYVRLNLSLAEAELHSAGGGEPPPVSEVLDRLQSRLGRSR